jgi:phospholipase C
MVVISPWSKGGWVSSEVFDHTSLIRFIEKRFGPHYPGITEQNITKWRRAVAGDLTSAFNFTSPNPATVPLPSTVAYIPPDNKRHPDYVPAPPADQALPTQEPGTRPARAVPYDLHVFGQVEFQSQTIKLAFSNTGKAAAVYQVRSGNTKTGPWTYTVAPGAEVSDLWTLSANPGGEYDLSAYGPNGFLRSFKGSTSSQNAANIHVTGRYSDDRSGITLEVANNGAATQVSILDVYTGDKTTHTLKPGEEFTTHWSLQKFHNWYDLVVEVNSDSSFQRRLAGHVETGEDSVTDPAIGAPTPQSQALQPKTQPTPVLA